MKCSGEQEQLVGTDRVEGQKGLVSLFFLIFLPVTLIISVLSAFEQEKITEEARGTSSFHQPVSRG